MVATRASSAPALRLALAALALASAAIAKPAQATCMLQCDAELIGAGCAATTSLAVGAAWDFAVKCQTCCAAPGGPLNCNPSEPQPADFKVQDAPGAAVAGDFDFSPLSCKKALRFKPAGQAPGPGGYRLLHTNMILLEFQIESAGGEDGGSADTSAADTSAADAGPADAGATDAGAVDAGPADVQPSDAGKPATDAATSDVGASDANSSADAALGADGGFASNDAESDAGNGAGNDAGNGAGSDAGSADAAAKDVDADTAGGLDAGDAGPGATTPAPRSSGGCSASSAAGAKPMWQPMAALVACLLLVRGHRRQRRGN